MFRNHWSHKKKDILLDLGFWHCSSLLFVDQQFSKSFKVYGCFNNWTISPISHQFIHFILWLHLGIKLCQNLNRIKDTLSGWKCYSLEWWWVSRYFWGMRWVSLDNWEYGMDVNRYKGCGMDIFIDRQCTLNTGWNVVGEILCIGHIIYWSNRLCKPQVTQFCQSSC